MRQGALLAAALGALVAACEGRELSVFDVPAMVGGSSAQAGTAGAGEPSGGAGGAGSSAAIDSVAGSATAGSVAIAGGAGGSGGEASQGGGGGVPPSMMAPQPCQSDDDCQGWICDKPGCDAATPGSCVPFPTFCDPSPRPVCGCDGVTYWNDCIRLQSHARVSASEQCRDTACTCEVGSDCKVPNASCGHLLPPDAMCGHAMGACWVLPFECDAAADPKRFRECKPPAGVPPQCVDTCTAISQEHSFAELQRGEACP
jgi:hypothetical protein